MILYINIWQISSLSFVKIRQNLLKVWEKAFALTRTSQQTGLYHLADKRLETVWGFFDIPVVPEKIYFKVRQYKIALSRAGNSQERNLKFL